jgi:hypothetical protein
MMKRRSLTLILVFFTCAASAQWVPITGRIVTTTEAVGSDGTMAQKWTTTSQYSRSSSGSVLVQRIGRSGKPASATLMDYGKTQKVYTLTYNGGQVTDMHRPLDREYAAHPPAGMSPAHKKITLGNDKVNGVDCFIVPVFDVGPNRTRVQVGKAWLAPAYNNLVMREDLTRVSPYGSKRHTVREFRITSQSEPNPSLFSTDRKVVASHWTPILTGN